MGDTSTATLTFLKTELNLAQRFILPKLENFTIHRTQTTLTVNGQQYYHLPPDAIAIESVKIHIGSVDYILENVDSQRRWFEYNSITFSGIAIP